MPILTMQLFLGQYNHNFDLCIRETSEVVTAMPERKSNTKTGGATSGRNCITMTSKLIRAVMEVNLSFPFLQTDVLQHCCSFCHWFAIYNPGYSWVLRFLFTWRVVGCFPVVDLL